MSVTMPLDLAQRILERLEYPGPSWAENRSAIAAELRAAIREENAMSENEGFVGFEDYTKAVVARAAAVPDFPPVPREWEERAQWIRCAKNYALAAAQAERKRWAEVIENAAVEGVDLSLTDVARMIENNRPDLAKPCA